MARSHSTTELLPLGELDYNETSHKAPNSGHGFLYGTAVNYCHVTAEKQQAYDLIDQLDAGQLAAIVHLLRVMTDPVARAIANAPIEDEPLSTEGLQALDEARSWSKDHERIPHERVLSELGITQKEIDRFNESR